MGSTNKTSNYELSQFLGSDSPKWLTDYNSDMQKIDAGIAGVKTQADATDLVVSGHTTTIGNLNTEVTDQTTAIQNLRTQVTTNTGSINTINSLIGNGTPTTTDQTIIGAINELHAEIGGGSTISVDADDVTYTNTSSGLTATNVQDAIDEVVAAIPSVTTPDADDVSYSNTVSGLTATNVQDAIDELAANTEGLNNLGTIVDIISHNTFANAYTVPSNGYVRVNSGSSASIAIRIYGNNSTSDTDPFVGIRSDNSNASATLIHKGMKIYVFASNGTGNELKFIPLE